MSLQPRDDSSFFVALMPNRGKTRFWRAAILFFLACGVLGCLLVAVSVLSEFHARYSWPVAQGQVTAADVESNKGRPGNLTGHTTYYWAEYEVRFAVPAEQ